MQNLIHSVANKADSQRHKLLGRLSRGRVLAHKQLLLNAKTDFLAYPDILFCIQAFNKQSSIKKVLKPFLDVGAKNILLFADGCIDKTSERSHSVMRGDSHYVVNCNDLHEIRNYRLALEYASFLGCQHLVLLQDDDRYETAQFFRWIRDCKILFEQFNCAMIGGSSGGQIIEDFDYCFADNSIATAEFSASDEADGRKFYGLGPFEKWEVPTASSNGIEHPFCFAAHVNRAPLIVDVSVAKALGFFPVELEPYQYDDYWNCFSAWMSGHTVVLAPICGKSGIGEGGMRLYNNVKLCTRPAFFERNWNYVLSVFGPNLVAIRHMVESANQRLRSDGPKQE